MPGYNPTYRNDRLNRIAFPLGGIGAGMICLEGTGALSHVSLRHKPEMYHEPILFSALHVHRAGSAREAGIARVLEGPVPRWKAFGPAGSGNGGTGKTYGFPRFARADFTARFPFAAVRLRDPALPIEAEVVGWSPFVPGDADQSSLPVAGLEYRLRNRGRQAVDAVFSFHAANFMRINHDSGASVEQMPGGFTLVQPALAEKPWTAGSFAAFVADQEARSDCAWFRGGGFDALTALWNHIAAGQAPAHPPHADKPAGAGGSLYLPVKLRAGEQRVIRLHLAWYVPLTELRYGEDPKKEDAATGAGGGDCNCPTPAAAPATHKPWYAGRFASLAEVAGYWRDQYESLRRESSAFANCFYDTTLPAEVVEAVAANLTILKSPTVLRQTDGRLWAWEGCGDGGGCCHGSCTHVWNYAQALPHLFPSLERSLRDTEFLVDQDDRGHQTFRASLPIRQPTHSFHAAADGQLGGIVKAHREWRISGNIEWLKSLWPKIRQSLDFAIEQWDPDRTGTLIEPHHNTYDIEFWGADGMCTSFYLSALAAAIAMGQACEADVSSYQTLLGAGRRAMVKRLFNGSYFFQRVQWQGLRAADPTISQQSQPYFGAYSPEARAIFQKEGPKYQYGAGCLSDGVMGDWLARVSGLPPVLDPARVGKHLDSVFKHNFRADLSEHANPQRPTYAFGKEGGLLLCSWPRGGKPSLPFIYSDEVWTGIEYQVAAHLIMMGRVKEGLTIVRTARDRYDGRHRNPFNEYECGHWYARAMSSYSLLQALSGARYDAVEKTLYLHPRVRGDFRAFLSTATGYGTVGVRGGKPFCEVKAGKIDIAKIDYRKA